jgi:hypothetical protein
MGGQMKAILRRTAVFYLCCASTVAFAGKLPGGTGVNFRVGYNEAWFGPNYINYLASNPSFNLPYPNGSKAFDPNFVDKVFAGIATGGAKIVRIWVFTALQGIDVRQSAPPNPQTYGLTPDLKPHLQIVFAKARKYGLKVYVTALNGGDMQVAKTPGLRPYFQNLISNNRGEREAFKTNALGPLVDLFNATAVDENGIKFQNRDVIYALDLINEIEAPLNSKYFPAPSSWAKARGWIQNLTAYVKSRPCGAGCVTGSWLPVTASAGWGSAVQEITFGLFSGLGLDFYDLHFYADNGQYSGLTALCNRVSADRVLIILGEYGQKSHTISDYIQDVATYNFISTAKTHCFSAALAWKYETSEAWWTYLKPDGNFRQAYYIVKTLGTPQSAAVQK